MGLRVLPRFAALAPLAMLLALTGCGQFFPPQSGGGGGGGGGTTTGDYLYVGNLATSVVGVAGFSISSSGLSALSGSPTSTAIGPFALAVSPNNQYLYVGGGPAYEVNAYPINSNGSLGTGNAYGGVGPSALRIDSTGSWLIGSDSVQGTVYSFAINSSNGALSQPSGNSIATLPNCSPSTNMVGLPQGLVIGPGRQYVYASCGTAGIYVLSFNSSNGALAETGHVNPANTNGADSGLAIATTTAGSYLLAAETVTNGVRVFAINSTTGQLTQISGSPFATGGGPDAILVDSTHSHVYVANRTDGTISGFTLAASGGLTPVSGSPFATGKLPVAMVEDNTDTYIAVACAGGNSDLETYTIGSNPAGALVLFKTSATGTDPTTASSIAATH